MASSSTILVSRTRTLPPNQIGDALLRIAEDQWFDRKSIAIKSQKLAEAVIGLANADGGTLVIGLSDGKIQGTNHRRKHCTELMQAHIQHCTPAVPAKPMLVPCINSKGEPDELLIIDVRAGDTVYATKADDVFLRSGDTTRKLTFSQRQELMYDRGQGSFEVRVAEDAGLDHVHEELLQAYAETVSAPDPHRLLQARGLAKGDQLTFAGALLFSKDPGRFLPEAFVRVLRYRGTARGTGSRQTLLSDDRIEGPIPLQLLEAPAAIRRVQPHRRALTGDGIFENVPLVPEDAWLEGLVNAVVHRSYSVIGDHIRVDIFDDRIEIESPGRFPGVFQASNPLESPRYARNPRIARVCTDQKFSQELGEGIRRMFDEMRKAGLADPLYEQTEGSVKLTLLAEPVDRELEARLPTDARRIISAIRDAHELSTREVAEAAGISRPTASKRLKILRTEGLVVWTGKSANDPRASWKLPPPV